MTRTQLFANYPTSRATCGNSRLPTVKISAPFPDDQDDEEDEDDEGDQDQEDQEDQENQQVQEGQKSVSTTEPGLEASQRCSYQHQKVFPLISLPTELLAMILKCLSPNESLHCGLSCRRLYNIHFKIHSKVPLELIDNFDASEVDQGSSVSSGQKDSYPHLWRKRVTLGKITMEEFLQKQRDDVLSKPLLAPPVHALLPKQKIEASIAQTWGFVRVSEEIVSGVRTVKREVKILKDHMKHYYAGGHPPNMRQMPKCGYVLFKPKSQWCSRCEQNQNTQFWEWKESDGNGNIVSFICRVQ
ncbi:hypothetical protein HYALB_00013726 [Hymenoscyphus albidus]|uniref:F-box domain-containing protein n=1 Tax=Hymenoscyphus albidus TaxID=595503 RepID=A0A9N9LTC9_9HELO|nr:hypothetical protein HYALB_00013726 [Hymenoscyphus albidus]